MEINRLRSIIRESISNNLKEIEDVAENAAMEAKLNAYTEAIDKVNKKIEMAESLEEMQELVDPTKLNELKKHLKTLEKSKEKLEKVKAKKNKGKEVVTDEPVEEAEVEEGNAMGMDNAIVPEMDYTMEEEEAINESFLKMQKLAGVITETQYNQKKSLIKENKSLSPEEQETLDFILGGENLEEGVSQVLDKIKSVARKGALTLGIVTALLSAVPASAKADVLTTINTVAPELDLSTIDYSTAQATASKDDPRVALTANLKSTNPYIINSKSYSTDIPFTSWNYGAHAGKSNATVGLSLSMDKGSDMISIDVTHVKGKSTAGYEAVVAAAKALGAKTEYGNKEGIHLTVSKDKASDVVNFVKASVGNLTK
jgi:hypothetical protein